MFKNLEVLIFERGISKYDMAKAIGKGYNTLLAKLSGKQPLKLDEAFKIQKKYFPDKTIEWLFEELFTAVQEQKSA